MKVSNAAHYAAAMLCAVALITSNALRADEHAGPQYVPYKANSIYAVGDTVGWNVTLPWTSPAANYVIRKNNLD